MARTAVAKTQTTDVTNWESELERQALIASGMEANSGTNAFFSVRAGQLSFDGAPIPGNQMAVVIVDSILENVYYEGAYDAENPSPPTCFALGRDDTLAPHETVVEAGQAQHEACKGCPQNEWGSAERGRGKACRNTRRVAMIPAGTIDVQSGRFTPFTDVQQFAAAPLGYFKIPVTSVAGYATYVKQIAGALKRPPHGVFTKVRVVPDAKTQLRVLFEPLEPAPATLIPTLMKRHAEVAAAIEFPYDLTPREAPSPTPLRGKAPARKAKY